MHLGPNFLNHVMDEIDLVDEMDKAAETCGSVLNLEQGLLPLPLFCHVAYNRSNGSVVVYL